MNDLQKIAVVIEQTTRNFQKLAMFSAKYQLMEESLLREHMEIGVKMN